MEIMQFFLFYFFWWGEGEGEGGGGEGVEESARNAAPPIYTYIIYIGIYIVE